MAAPASLRLLFLRPALLHPSATTTPRLLRSYTKHVSKPPRSAPSAPPKKAALIPPSKRASPPTPNSPPSLAYIPLAERLAKSTSKTLLYAKYSGKHLIASYGLATTAVVGAVEFYDARIANPPVELPVWAQGATWAAIAFYSCVAAYFLWRPSRIVEKIYAVPRQNGKEPWLELHRRRLLPGLPLRKVLVEVEGVRLDRPLEPVRVLEKLPWPEKLPWRQSVAQAPAKALQGVRGFLFADGFEMLRVRGFAGGLLLSRQNPYVWEKRGLDRLLPKQVGVMKF
ncbi:hypothetical protein FN846DRAFT_944097 [Sphaerosporella brunnea]|uniref:Uncharacterized protein n=1 Tax=Sphaerosporella brunnea TaxID=1250544 RepID=A0A5J5F136_9PEZI|nr:hypothetical protein FN846DRAFT_944097 [Sphaerosporella brunnea]